MSNTEEWLSGARDIIFLKGFQGFSMAHHFHSLYDAVFRQLQTEPFPQPPQSHLYTDKAKCKRKLSPINDPPHFAFVLRNLFSQLVSSMGTKDSDLAMLMVQHITLDHSGTSS